jgi:hypothetical protein
MFTVLSGFLRSRCTILQRTEPIVNAFGDQEAGYPVLPGHDSIACSLAAKSGNTQEQASEVRTNNGIFVAEARHCILDGYYPLIKPEMIAVVDGVNYDIRGVVHSSIKAHTKLMLEVIS